MKFLVTRNFNNGGHQLHKGCIVEFEPTRRIMSLVQSKFLIPQDADAVVTTETPPVPNTDKFEVQKEQRAEVKKQEVEVKSKKRMSE